MKRSGKKASTEQKIGSSKARRQQHGGCGVLLACLMAALLFGRQVATGFIPSASTHRLASVDEKQPVIARRNMFIGLASLFGSLGSESSVLALKDARTDSICTYKCLDICKEKAPNNPEYCTSTCDNYCRESENQKNLEAKVNEGSVADKIMMRVRKGRFDGRRADDKTVEKFDQFFGKIIALNNETDYKLGIAEAKRN
eukprot:TRINITY_DN59967_c0_g1_i1.p1 TRINITY_DN59967_c0_g1~~TRINITY_DN59967_c0_g1_i1.p1  ORF type:complete len:199 (-),score=39.73 TRINITY_DN59967_c0_g1_i1:124-720(-)